MSKQRIGALLLALSVTASAEDYWVVGSYEFRDNADAEQVRISDLLEVEVLVIPNPEGGTHRVVIKQSDIPRERIYDVAPDNWRLFDVAIETIERDGSPPDKDSYATALAGEPPRKSEFLDAIRGAPVPLPTAVPAPAAPPPAPSGSSEPNETTVVISSEQEPKAKETGKPSFVPPGFEELLEPQTTIVDVYYGNQFLVSTSATFTPNSISFNQPQEIVGKLPDVLEPQSVAGILSDDMPTNTEFLCLKANQTGCGSLDPENVDVIFDDGRFRADLFIAPDLLAVRPASASKYLPASTGGLSLLNVTSATFNGQESLDNNYNIGNTTTIAFKETRLYSVSNFTKQDDLTFDTLALQREFNGQLTQAGVFRSNPGNLVFLGQEDFAGVSISSSLNTRTDLEQSTGNDLQIFLETRSRVDVFKDGRLVSTNVYDAGNQILDTSQLPDGAYDVTLRIRDNLGGFREETRFYVKTNRLPPRDQTLYFFDVGEKVVKSPGDALPESTGEGFIRTGLSKRLTPNFGGDVGVSGTEDEQLYEAGFFNLGRSYDLRVSYAHGSDDSRGATVNTRMRMGAVSVHADARKVWSDAPTDVLGTALTQGSLNLTIPVVRGTFNLTSRYNKRDTGTTKNLGVRYDFPTIPFGKQFFDASIQFTENNDDTLVLLGIRLSRRGDNWNNQVAAQYFDEERAGFEPDNGMIGNVSSTWRDGDRFLSDVNFTMRAVEEQSDSTVESELDYRSDLGRANVEVVYSDETERTSYGASFFTSVIANSNTVSLGGRNQAQSAVVLDIEGDTRDAYFDVLVNGSPKGNAQIGRKTIIGLAPYETYEVALEPRGKSIVNFNNVIRTATLYPGNVVSMDWQVTKVLIAFGQVVDENGEAVANAVIEGVLGLATTDDFGFFQAEIESGTETFTVRTRERQCTVSVPDYDASKLIVMLNKLTCR